MERIKIKKRTRRLSPVSIIASLCALCLACACVAVGGVRASSSSSFPSPQSVGGKVSTNRSAVYSEPPAPRLPAAGGKFFDPTFGTEIMRVTDARDGAAFGTAYSYWPTFNLDNTRLIAHASDGGAPLVCGFDPINFRLLSKEKISPMPGVTTFEDAIWSGVEPDILYAHGGARLYAYNAAARTYKLVRDLAAQLPSAGYYLHQMSASRDDDTFAFTVKKPDGAVGGYLVYRRSTDRVLLHVRTPKVNEVQIDKTGRFLTVNTGEQGKGVVQSKVHDLQTGRATDLLDNEPDFAPGHADSGRGSIIGADNWLNRLTHRNLSDPRRPRTVFEFGGMWDNDLHVSLLGDDEAWVLVSFVGDPKSGLFRRELVLVATDGSQRVRRIAHHRSVYRDYHDSPRANVSRDGKYVAFTSNWGGSNRRDLFVAKLSSGAQTTAAPMNKRPHRASQGRN